MREIDGYLLTDEEAKACLKLIKQMRKRYFADCNCHLKIQAKDSEAAYNVVKNWITDIQEYTNLNWDGVILNCDINVNYEGLEE